DSYTQTDILTLDDVKNLKKAIISYIGYLIEETDEIYKLAGLIYDWNEENHETCFKYVYCIPKKAVIDMKIIQKKVEVKLIEDT
ncbi:MAG: hypothetical protein EAX89_15480, partial [Candidatus Lokiarchaeota archaeon]|nr:hypothetical protein [Candidatus Lokiarchaeota archaeon]